MSEATLFSNGTRLRAGWRIAVWVALFLALFVVGSLGTSVLPRDALGWQAIIITTAAALAAGWIVLSRLDDRPPGALGFHIQPGVLREVGVGLALGAALMLGATLLLWITGGVAWVPDAGSPGAYLARLAQWALFFALAAAAEELIFRGYPFQALVEGIGAWPAVLLSSALFAAAHGGNPNVGVFALINIFLAGVLLALCYLRTRSLWFATAVHLSWNWTMAALLDFPVSGLTAFDTPLYTAVETAPDWWSGGAFGPEAGAAGTLALLAGVAWLMRPSRPSEPPQVRALGPIVDRRLQPREP